MNEQAYDLQEQIDLSEWVQSIRDLPDVLLQQASMQWARVGAKHLARTKIATPVGNYPKFVDFWTRDGKHVQFTVKKVRLGGQLRLRWQQSSVEVGENSLTTTVFNNVEYAPFVEYGHRIRRHGETIGYVQGQFFMTNSLAITEQVDIPNAVNEIMTAVSKHYAR